jgi:hypothetical protein
MDRWLKLKRKNTEDVNECASCSKQSDLIQKMTKCRKYDVEYLSIVGFEVLTAVGKKMAVFWVVAPCRLVEILQRLRGPCCLHHDEGSKVL